jgi:hypothetical protein
VTSPNLLADVTLKDFKVEPPKEGNDPLVTATLVTTMDNQTIGELALFVKAAVSLTLSLRQLPLLPDESSSLRIDAKLKGFKVEDKDEEEEDPTVTMQFRTILPASQVGKLARFVNREVTLDLCRQGEIPRERGASTDSSEDEITLTAGGRSVTMNGATRERLGNMYPEQFRRMAAEALDERDPDAEYAAVGSAED